MQSIAYAQDKCIDSQLLITSIVAIFEYRQLDVNRLLKGTGIFRQDLQLIDHKISPLQLMSLIDNALALWPGDDLAFLLGQQWLPVQSGSLTNGLFCCDGLAQMQNFWHQYHWASQPWLQGWHWRTENLQHLLLQLDIGAQRQQRFFIELTLSSLVSTYKKLSHNTWQGHFSLPYTAPKLLDQYYKYLGEDLSFNQPICVISYDPDIHQHPFELANSQGLKLARQQVKQQKQAAHYRIGLPAAIRLLLIRRKTRSYTLPQIAEQLSLSPATLKRRLKAYDIRFQQLQDQANMQQAIFLLAISGENNLTVAKQLQFADGNNFRRSFKRWTGQLPSQFKYWLSQVSQP
ncbi:AraC family transcriptional regulator [Shewanella sp. Choline-02u-19]|uniref:AraC family transcriptional regulator n=1 Tax=unclassified Shewanella TaxID=196818 RepID=UPI000C322D44|nr:MULTISPECIES: AraC family transcriptional regulator [unclassified Shewanella]PKG74675.1 AraC family transcriptional regulator [Shewanella sp. GutCb]PKH56071.1 AraC family transcriptional regulator [Shewanella sp. Bg11-22]PKI30659.1 AraC family transcriptional regulator [Shewanella sp. Choline-02u-19]